MVKNSKHEMLNNSTMQSKCKENHSWCCFSWTMQRKQHVSPDPSTADGDTQYIWRRSTRGGLYLCPVLKQCCFAAAHRWSTFKCWAQMVTNHIPNAGCVHTFALITCRWNKPNMCITVVIMQHKCRTFSAPLFTAELTQHCCFDYRCLF